MSLINSAHKSTTFRVVFYSLLPFQCRSVFTELV